MTPGPEDEVSQSEKRAIMRQDADVRRRQQEEAERRDQSGTFFSHAQSQAAELSGGRFSAVNATMVTGADPVVKYPAAAAHQRDPVPDEPPLGYRIDAMPAQAESAGADSEARSSSIKPTEES